MATTTLAVGGSDENCVKHCELLVMSIVGIAFDLVLSLYVATFGQIG